jgi:hypothetical protein
MCKAANAYSMRLPENDIPDCAGFLLAFKTQQADKKTSKMVFLLTEIALALDVTQGN